MQIIEESLKKRIPSPRMGPQQRRWRHPEDGRDQEIWGRDSALSTPSRGMGREVFPESPGCDAFPSSGEDRKSHPHTRLASTRRTKS
jgi:hypothetical protein